LKDRKDIVVLGLGNPLMSDEGIGGFIIERLAGEGEKYENIDFVDAGVGGINLLHYMADRRKVILVDCAFMGREPGTMERFGPEEVKSVKKLAHLSLHEADVLKIIEMARQLGRCPEEIVIFGIEPASVELEQQLSETIAARVDDYVAAISKELVV